MRLLWRVRARQFGSRLLLKLAAIFALVGVVPGVLIYTVSYQFVSRCIESWFDVKVEGALDAGLNLGRGTLDALVSDLGTKTRLAAERLGEARVVGRAAGARAAARAARRRSEVALVGSAGQILLSAGSAALRADARAARAARCCARRAPQRVVEPGSRGSTRTPPGGATPSARVRAVAADPEHQLRARRAGALPAWSTQPCAPRLAANALAVQQGLPRVPAARARARAACARCTSAR